MSLDLYRIGTNLIHSDGIAASLADLQDITDQVSRNFVTHVAAVDLASAATGIEEAWSLAADASERLVAAAGSSADSRLLESFESLSGGNINLVGSGSVAALYNRAAGRDDQACLQPYWDSTDPDFVKAIGELRGLQSALPMERAFQIGQLNAFEVADANLASSATNAGVPLACKAVTNGVALDKETLVGLFGHSQAHGWQSPLKAQDANGSELGFGTTGSLDRDGIVPYDFQKMGKGVGPAGLELEGIRDAKFGSVAPSISNENFAVELANQMIFADDSVGPDDASGSGGLKQNRFSSIPRPSEYNSAASGLDDRVVQLDGIYPAPDDLGVSFHNGSIDPLVMAFGLAPTSGYRSSDVSDAAPYNTRDLTDVLRGMTPVGAQPNSANSDMLHGLADLMERDPLSKGGPATYSSDLTAGGNHTGGGTPALELDSLPMSEKFGADRASTGSGDAQAARLGETEGAALSSGPPGWLVALTSAVVMELTRSARDDQATPLDDSVARRQGPVTPSGTRNDPLHVKVVDHVVAYGTHMPIGPTASLPSQSLPIPGRVSFSA
jgi:hypothetical protein